MNIQLAATDAEIATACTVLRELRPQYAPEELIQAVKRQVQEGYRLACCLENDACIGVMGFVTGHKLAWKKHIYIDDLVVTEKRRSSGAGAALLAWIRQYAREHDCTQIHLDSGVQRFAAHKFYLNHGYRIASHHFSLTEP